MGRQYKSIKKEIDFAVERVLGSSVFIGGTEVEMFEKEMARLAGVKYAVSVNSGTDALYLSLKALGIGSGDEVITTPFTFVATAESIAACQAKPVFVDINPKTFNIDPEKISAAITKKTKAIMPVHLYGQMADMPEIVKIAKKYKLKIIEDAAQAVGAEQQRCQAGSAGDIGCFSFFPSKNLGACGDGGMVVTNNKKLAESIRLFKNHGSSPKEKYLNLVLGTNSRLDSIQAAILRVKLKHLKNWNKKRASQADYYNRKLKKINFPTVSKGNVHIYHQYTIRINKRKRLIDYLKKQGIPTMVYYPLPLHLQPAFKYLGHKEYPEAEKAAKEVLSLPIYPELKRKEQDYIIQKINAFCA